ncbi:MAG TPA: PfkB family carbohydrate kinase [Pyrinomonadaceae bacterium]|nr:PfkB family carbohydrate kinase [Pyrinomonadaceae bacterium]
MKNLSEIINQTFPDKTIVIVGDLVADQFLRGTIARVSREAPVFILRHDETETFAGGAANAATNVASLQGKAVLIGVVGKDPNGGALLEKLAASNVNCDFVIASEKLTTTTKVRVLAGQHYAPRQQVIRIDYENQQTIDAETLEQLKANLTEAARKADALIISDYNYGVANREIAAIAKKIAAEKQIPLLVDSRFSLRDFQNATTATPNQEEVEQILGKDFTQIDCAALCGKLGYEALLVTRGNKGMVLIEKDKTPFHLEAIGSKEPVDVTGAGDTVIATYALGLACSLSFAESANLANHAGGIVVMKKGTASVSAEELIASLSKTAVIEQKAQTL